MQDVDAFGPRVDGTDLAKTGVNALVPKTGVNALSAPAEELILINAAEVNKKSPRFTRPHSAGALTGHQP
jgi:hypothetical protein